MSAGFRNNIDPFIQAGLEARVSASSGFGVDSTTVMKNPLLGSVSTDFTDGGKTGGVVFSKAGQFGKSPYVRMIAAGEERTDVIYGMFNPEMGKLQDTAASGKNTFGEMTGLVTGGPEAMYYNLENPGGDQYKRFGPSAAGIKTITCDFLGSGRSGAAVRKATINWICYSLNDLAKYQVGSFLSPGRTIILDWGWVRADKDALTEPPAVILGSASAPTLNEEMFKRPENENGTLKPSAWDTLQRDYYGDWDGIVGKIVKFDWKQREDGAFDCTTEVIAQGSNVFNTQILPADDKTPHVPAIGTFNLEEVLQDVYKDINIDPKLSERLAKAPKLNISERIAILDLELLFKYQKDYSNVIGIVNEENELIEHSSNPIVFMPSDQAFVTIIYPYQRPAVEGEKPEDVPYVIAPIQDGEKTGTLSRHAKFRNEMWLNWGWFEDNIVSYYGRHIVDLEKGESARFRSVVVDKGSNHYESVKIKNRKKSLYTMDKSFLLPGQFPVQWHPENLGQTEQGVIKENPYKKLALLVNQARPFDDGKQHGEVGKGFLRNIYINLEVIRSVFSAPGASIASAMLGLAKRLDGGLGLWKFEVSYVDAEIIEGKESDESSTQYKAPLMGLGEDSSQEKKDDNDPANSFIFENFGLNSLVKDVSMNTTLSSNFMYAMALGSRKGDLTDDPLSTALGRKKKDPLDIDAESLGLFYSDPANMDKLANLINPKTLGGKVDTFDSYGNKGAAVGPRFVGGGLVPTKGSAGVITGVGLDGNPFNHEINDRLIKLVPTARDNYAEAMFGRFSEISKMGISSIDVGKLTKGDTNLAEEIKKLRMIAFPPDKIKNTKFDFSIEELEEKKIKFQLPYDTSCNLRPQYMKTLRWYNGENDLTRLLSIEPDYKQYPLKVDMTIEGCGGILPRDIFRLAYLPESYGQTNIIDPKTYFHIMSVTHEISDSGWTTKFDAVLAGNEQLIKKEKQAALEELGLDEPSLRTKIQATFIENLNAVVPLQAPPEPKDQSPQGSAGSTTSYPPPNRSTLGRQQD